MAMQFLQNEAKHQMEVKMETADLNKDAAKRAEAKFKAALNNNSGRKAIVNDGDLVQRVTFSPWEALVQAILFSNEAAYVN